MFALVDGNNFWVSCERVFRPSLAGHSVVVLTNDDSCAIAHSDEAKALGIRIGHPFFRFQREFSHAGVIAIPANSTLRLRNGVRRPWRSGPLSALRWRCATRAHASGV